MSLFQRWLSPRDDVDDPEGFQAFVDRLCEEGEIQRRALSARELIFTRQAVEQGLVTVVPYRWSGNDLVMPTDRLWEMR